MSTLPFHFYRIVGPDGSRWVQAHSEEQAHRGYMNGYNDEWSAAMIEFLITMEVIDELPPNSGIKPLNALYL